MHQTATSVARSFVFSSWGFVDRSFCPQKQGRSTKSHEQNTNQNTSIRPGYDFWRQSRSELFQSFLTLSGCCALAFRIRSGLVILLTVVTMVIVVVVRLQIDVIEH